MRKFPCLDRSWNQILFSWPWSKNQFIMVLSWSLLLVCKTRLCAMQNTKTLSFGSLILEGWIQASRNFFRNDVVFCQLLLVLLCLKISQRNNQILNLTCALHTWMSFRLWMKSITCHTLSLSLSLAVQLYWLPTLTHILRTKSFISNCVCLPQHRCCLM